MTKSDCRHRWRYIGYTGVTLDFHCLACQQRASRPATKGEIRHLAANTSFKLRPPKSEDVHAVWHDFERRFINRDGTYRLKGWGMMRAAERWGGRFPDDVRIVRVDDSCFSSSILILIEHKTKDRYMGTSMVVVPQCSGEPPVQMFLYPNHCQGLVAALNEIGTVAKKTERRSRQRDREREAAWKKVYAGPPKGEF